MANKYKQRRRQLRQTQTESGSSYASDALEDLMPGIAVPSPLAANVDAPPKGFVKYAIALMLLVAVCLVYVQTARHEFTVCDDNVYIFENPAIEQGLTRPLLGPDGLFSRGFYGMFSWVRWEAVIWAYGDSHAGNWHPLTWITHMLDWQIYGQWSHEQQKYVDSWPGGHHLTNMILHALNTIILFFALRNLTGRQWASAAVAMLFAVHPLRAESVAWSAERKDVLCGFFWMLTMLCYSKYVRRPLIDWTNSASVAWAIIWSVAWYFTTWAMLWFALMAKSMAVTLPCVLFILDFWPLNRLANRFAAEEADESSSSRFGWLMLKVGLLAMEKVPWLSHVAWVCYGTILGQHKGVALNSFDALPMWMRLVNMSLAYVAYLGQSFWPTHMAPFYTHLGMIPSGTLRHSMTREVIVSAYIAAVFLMLITMFTVAMAFIRGYRWLAVGWFWYLGTLMPVIGVLQVGTQSRADRYTYLPTIGIAIMVVWGIRSAVDRLPSLRTLLGPLVVLPVGTLIVLAWLQASYWKTSYTLFEHAVRVTDRNFFAYNHLGIAYDKDSKDGSYTLTERHRAEFEHSGIPFDESNPDEKLPLTIDQRHALADLSAKNFAETIKIKPDYDFGNNNLGVYYANKNDIENAAKYFEKALQCNDRYADVYNNLGVLYRIEADRLREKGEIDKANQYLQMSLARHMSGLKVRQDKASDYNNVAQTLHELGQDDEAIKMLNTALAIDPSFIAAHVALAEFLLKNSRVNEADVHIAKALAMDPNSWTFLAQGMLNRKDFPLALSAADEIIKIVPQRGVGHIMKAQIDLQINKIDDAVAEIRNAIKAEPDNINYRHMLTKLLWDSGHRIEAIEAHSEVVRLYPNNAEEAAILAQLRKQAGMAP